MSFSEFILDIENEKEQLDFKVDAELRRRGWNQSSSHPGALWLWEKNGYKVPKNIAIHIEKWWDAYGEKPMTKPESKLKEYIAELRYEAEKYCGYPKNDKSNYGDYLAVETVVQNELPRLLDLLERAIEVIDFYGSQDTYDLDFNGNEFEFEEERRIIVDHGARALNFLSLDPSTLEKERGE